MDIVGSILLLLTLLTYGIPIAVAVARELPAPTTAWITLLTVLLGWTVVGWMAALGWALAAKNPRAADSVRTGDGA